MSSDIQICRITPDLAEHAAAFFHACLENTFSETFPDVAITQYRQDFTTEKLREYIEVDDRVLLAALRDRDIVGIMFGSPPRGGVAYVVWIAVKPDLRRHRIGERLMLESFRRYKEFGAHKIALYTETEGARRFYEKVGMLLEGVHHEHWWKLTYYCFGRHLNDLRDELG